MPRKKKEETKLTEKTKKLNRPSWDEYFLQIMDVVGRRSTCDRGFAATVIVKDKQILATGYSGAPVGLPHCDEVGHDLHTVKHPDGTESTHCLRTAHSEQNGICQAAKFGIPINGATLYTRYEPCAACAKMIINAGIKRVVCTKKYHGASETRKMFEQAGIDFEVLSDEMMTYDNM